MIVVKACGASACSVNRLSLPTSFVKGLAMTPSSLLNHATQASYCKKNILFNALEATIHLKRQNKDENEEWRRLVSKLIIAATTDAEMRYASQLAVPDPFILVDTGRKRHLLLSSLEYGRAKRELGRKKQYAIHLITPYYEAAKRRVKKRKGVKVRKGSILALIAAEFLKKKKIEKVVVSPTMWVIHVEQLKKAGIKTTLANGPLYPERAIKKRREINAIKNVRNATIEAMQRCITIMKQSSVTKKKDLRYKGERVTSEMLKREARIVLLRHGCEAKELIISHGRQTAYPHDMGSGPIKAGEPIIMDFFPRSTETGYWFDMTRTVCKGKIPKKLQFLYMVVKEAQETAMQRVKVGVTAGTIHKTVEEVFEKYGIETTEEEGYIHSTGHGVGLQIHEAPSLHEKATERLQAGMVLTVEPGLYYKKIGGVRLENTVLVTKRGYKDLTKMSRVLQV